MQKEILCLREMCHGSRRWDREWDVVDRLMFVQVGEVRLPDGEGPIILNSSSSQLSQGK
jgi:hypothetical protein